MTILLVKKLHQSGFGQCFKTGLEDKSDIYSDRSWWFDRIKRGSII